jgi:hypothetical protein
MTAWPYPGDSPLARARRIANAYRAALEDADPAACHRLDTLAKGWGETWVAPAVVTYDLDDWLTPAEAAELAAVSTATLRTWRHRGRLTGRQGDDGTWLYLAHAVLALATETRHRRPLQLR